MFRNILVPLDGSSRAERVLPVAARLARFSGGTVVLLRVVSPSPEFELYPVSDLLTLQTIDDAHYVQARNYLERIASVSGLKDVRTETTIIAGRPATTILSVVETHHIDLIILCSHGHTGVKHWVQGSVAQQMARQSPVPVLVLREGGALPAGARADSRPGRALVTLDGSVLASAALEPAAQLIAALSTPTPGALHLLRVVKPPAIERQADGSEEERACLREQAMHKARLYLRSVVEHLRAGYAGKLKLGLTWSVALSDYVAEAIIQAAEYGEDAAGAGVYGRCDVIAMATHGRTGFQHWALGSVAERVLGATRLLLLIVRPTEAEFGKAGEKKVPAPQGF